MTHRRSDTRLGAARAYHPRGRTVRERDQAGAGDRRGGDPYRAALKVFEEPAGGRVPAARSTTERAAPAPSGERGRAGRGAAESRGTAGTAGGRTGSGGTPNRRTGGGGSGAGAGDRRPPARRKPGRTAEPRRRGPGWWGRMVARRRSRAGSRPSGPPPLANGKRRLRLATVLVMALFAVVGMRLVEMQVTDGPAYAASGLQNRLQTVTLPAARGAIFDRHGAVLAHSVEARFIYADPELVVDPQRAAVALQPLLGVPASELAERMRPGLRQDGTPSRFEWLARGVDVEVAAQIEGLNLAGIGVEQDERRLVPGNDLAANLIGFTGTDLVGLEGLEAHYDNLLRGMDGERTYESGQGASLDRAIPGGYRVEIAPRPGSDLRLTIDMDLQYETQRALAEHLRAANASFGAAVVLDPRTGEVLAQASYPTYNAADPASVPDTARIDAATSTVFDPGSAHKPLVFGAALQEGAIAPGDTLTVDPSISKGDEIFRDAIPHPPGTELTLPEIMAYSSNVGTIMIADELGSQKLYEYQQAFGLGAATGVGLPSEAGGGLLPPEEWYGSSYGSVPIGHSVDVTTLQLAAAYGAIANDGVWVQPRLVQAVVAPDGAERLADDPASRRVLSAGNAAYLRELLEAVVSMPNATGQAAALPDYRVGGKTGTGKLVVDGEYADGDVATFVGMAPIDAPRYVIAVVAHTPRGGGGEVAGPAFRDMMGYTLSHYRVPPTAAAG